MAWDAGQNDFDVGKSISRAIGGDGPQKSRLFKAQMALPSLEIFRAHLFQMAREMDLPLSKPLNPSALQKKGLLVILCT